MKFRYNSVVQPYYICSHKGFVVVVATLVEKFEEILDKMLFVYKQKYDFLNIIDLCRNNLLNFLGPKSISFKRRLGIFPFLSANVSFDSNRSL